MSHIDYRAHFKRIFSGLEGEDHSKFYEHLDKNVAFYSSGNHPWSGMISGVNEVQAHGFEGINNYLQMPITYTIDRMMVEGNDCWVILNGKSVQKNGKRFTNRYCIYAEMDKKSRKLTKLEVFSDTQCIHELVQNNPPDLKIKNA